MEFFEEVNEILIISMVEFIKWNDWLKKDYFILLCVSKIYQ